MGDRSSASVTFDTGLTDDPPNPHQPVQLREFAIDIGVSAVEQRALLPRAHAAAGVLAVAAVQTVDDRHSFDDAAHRRKALRVVARVVDEVDVDLRRPRVGAGHREGERAAHVRVLRPNRPETIARPKSR